MSLQLRVLLGVSAMVPVKRQVQVPRDITHCDSILKDLRVRSQPIGQFTGAVCVKEGDILLDDLIE